MKSFMVFVTAGILASTFSPVKAETLTLLTHGAFSNPKQPDVVFHHDEHNAMAGIDRCESCHHVYENHRLIDDESSEGQPCSQCHQAVHFGNGLTLATAFHRRCKGCHLEVRQGPILCGQCHTGPDSFDPLLGISP